MAMAAAALAPGAPASDLVANSPDYARPARLVPLPDGRRINVVCTGHGRGPTVILIAGLGLWSQDWRKVQAPLSSTMRVCSWDRAGYGYSDAPRGAVTLVSSERDMEAWLRAAGIGPPYLIVGYSIGGIEARLFAARNPRATAGMVLVDPTVADQSASMVRIAPKLAALVNDERPLLRCLRASRSVTMSKGDRDRCIDPPPPGASATFRAAWPHLASRPSSFAGDLSTDRSLPEAARLLARSERRFGNRPIIVLTAGKTPPVADDIRAQAGRWTRYWRSNHQRIAALSRRGEERLVPSSSHTIEQDDPRAVVQAIQDVARRSASGMMNQKNMSSGWSSGYRP